MSFFFLLQKLFGILRIVQNKNQELTEDFNVPIIKSRYYNDERTLVIVFSFFFFNRRHNAKNARDSLTIHTRAR